VVEFVFVAIAVLVPLLYLVLAVSALQRHALAVTQAAREAGRAFATADDEAAGLERSARAVEFALADQGLADQGSGGDTWTSWREPGDGCDGVPTSPTLTPGAVFTVCVSRTFRLPGVPGHLDGGRNTVSGAFTVHVDDFRSAR
jgi:hypothetical protein